MAVVTIQAIQVGTAALRNPATGEVLPSVPVYIEATPEAKESEEKLEINIGKVFAEKFKQYVDSGGVEVENKEEWG